MENALLARSKSLDNWKASLGCRGHFDYPSLFKVLSANLILFGEKFVQCSRPFGSILISVIIDKRSTTSQHVLDCSRQKTATVIVCSQDAFLVDSSRTGESLRGKGDIMAIVLLGCFGCEIILAWIVSKAFQSSRPNTLFNRGSKDSAMSRGRPNCYCSILARA